MVSAERIPCINPRCRRTFKRFHRIRRIEHHGVLEGQGLFFPNDITFDLFPFELCERDFCVPFWRCRRYSSALPVVFTGRYPVDPSFEPPPSGSFVEFEGQSSGSWNSRSMCSGRSIIAFPSILQARRRRASARIVRADRWMPRAANTSTHSSGVFPSSKMMLGPGISRHTPQSRAGTGRQFD